MDDPDSLSPLQADSIQMIVTSGDLLLGIVNDVLDYNCLARGKLDIVVKQSNLQEAMSAVIHAANVKGASKGVVVETYYDLTVPKDFNTDVRRLQQILYNLIGNAIKFSTGGATIECSICICRADEEPSSTENSPSYSPPRVNDGALLPCLQGNVLRLSVKDYGKGIHEGDFEKIFQPFLQADQGIENLEAGAGLVRAGISVVGLGKQRHFLIAERSILLCT